MTENWPFGRQPKPVYIVFDGEQEDIDSIIQRFSAVCWEIQRINPTKIIAYPRAVND